MEKELKIMTATVTIQLVTVDGKRMTKAVFNQIQEENSFNSKFEFSGDSILGYVVSNYKWLLWIKNGELRKTSLEFFQRIQEIDVNICRVYEVEDIFDYLKKQKDHFKSEKGDMVAKRYYPASELKKLISFKKVSKEFLDKLIGNQLYIAI